MHRIPYATESRCWSGAYTPSAVYMSCSSIVMPCQATPIYNYLCVPGAPPMHACAVCMFISSRLNPRVFIHISITTPVVSALKDDPFSSRALKL
jgi:hypothetical protein